MAQREISNLWRVVQDWLDVLPYPPNQSRLASRLGVTRNALTEWKYGTSKPRPEHLDALANEMAPVAGPDVYDRLLEAVNLDQGYEPRARRRA